MRSRRRLMTGAVILVAGAICSRAGVLPAGPALAARGAVAAVGVRPEDPARPPRLLSETGLYAHGGTSVVDSRNRAFVPQYPLWSDGLTKNRWVYLPAGATIDTSDDHAWSFPPGTRFWKEFSLGNKKIETRFLWKASNAGWTYATYVWNDEGSDAVLAPAEGVPGAAEIAGGRRHSVPSAQDCTACHGTERGGPLGFNALQLSTDRDPHAVHGEMLQPAHVTLRHLVEEERLRPARPDLVARPPRIRTSSPTTRAVLGYLAANCGACHNGNGEIAALGPTLRMHDLLEDGDAVARSLVGRRTDWQIPQSAEGSSVLVHPGAPEKSALLLRMRSRSPSSQMPPLGTVLRDQEAVDLVTRWIRGEMVR